MCQNQRVEAVPKKRQNTADKHLGTSREKSECDKSFFAFILSLSLSDNGWMEEEEDGFGDTFATAAEKCVPNLEPRKTAHCDGLCSIRFLAGPQQAYAVESGFAVCTLELRVRRCIPGMPKVRKCFAGKLTKI